MFWFYLHDYESNLRRYRGCSLCTNGVWRTGESVEVAIFNAVLFMQIAKTMTRRDATECPYLDDVFEMFYD